MPRSLFKYTPSLGARFIATVQNDRREPLDLYWIVNTDCFFFVASHRKRCVSTWSMKTVDGSGINRELWERCKPLLERAVNPDPSVSPNA